MKLILFNYNLGEFELNFIKHHFFSFKIQNYFKIKAIEIFINF